MNERRQTVALFDTFLARFFENEMSDGSRDMKSSFMHIIGMLAVPGLFLPVSNLWRWTRLGIRGPEALRLESIADKAIYVSIAMGAVMLLAAVVWQALLADRRDAVVLGTFPVRMRTILAGKLAALFAYLGIVAGGMNVIAAVAYGVMLGGDLPGTARAVPAHFLASAMACMFACVAVAAFQAVTLAVGGPRLFARLTAPAQLVLAAAGLMLILFSPLVGAGAVSYVRGIAGSDWALWMPPMWFIGIYEVIRGAPAPIMPSMAARALLASGGAIAVLIAAYPLAYRRLANAAMQGSPLGKRRSIASVALEHIMRRLPARPETRGAAHYILLTISRLPRNKLIVATALGGAVAVCLPFVLRWAGANSRPLVPERSHIAVPFVFVLLGLVGTRIAYNVPSELGSGWIFSTGLRPARTARSAARVTGLLVGAALPAAISLPIYAWFWDLTLAISLSLTIFTFGALNVELGVRTVDFVPFTRAYNPGRSNLQARWPLYVIATVIFLQFLPLATRELLRIGNYWLAPASLAALTIGIALAHPPEPALLVDADHENKPLALRLY